MASCASRGAQDHDEPAQSLDPRGDIGRAELLAEVEEVGLQVAKLSASRDGIRPEQDAEFRRKFRRRALATAIPATPAATGGEMAPELGRAAFFGIVELIDGLLACPRHRTFEPHPSRDLFRRPAARQAIAKQSAERGRLSGSVRSTSTDPDVELASGGVLDDPAPVSARGRPSSPSVQEFRHRGVGFSAARGTRSSGVGPIYARCPSRSSSSAASVRSDVCRQG